MSELDDLLQAYQRYTDGGDRISVRWHWALPPFRARWISPAGSRRSIARWTPWTARWRAEELRDNEPGLILRRMGW